MGHLLSVLDEALANIVRHAHARKVLILAEDSGPALRIVIKDDGVGISGKASSGYGLRNMRDRARLLNGQLDIQAAQPKGTTVTLETPWAD
jgi:signal transduction histidine kinase